MCRCTRIYSIRSSCGHVGNFQYFAKPGHLMSDLCMYILLLWGAYFLCGTSLCVCIVEYHVLKSTDTGGSLPWWQLWLIHCLTSLHKSPSLSVPPARMINSILSMGSLWRLNELMCAKMLRTYLEHRKYSVKFAVCVCTRQCQGSTQASKCLTIGSSPTPQKTSWIVAFANFYSPNTLSLS